MNIYATAAMIAIINDLRSVKPWVLNRYFTYEINEQSEEIHFDKISKKRRIAPFVSPLVEGKIVQSQGFKTETFKPAYIKPKTPIDPNRAVKRAAGERIGGELSPMQRMQLALALELADHKEMIDTRLEAMAIEILQTGKVTITGEKYPTVVVDFGRASELTVALTGNFKWGGSTEKPLDDLQDWSALTLKASGAATRDVTMDVAAWNKFRKNAEVKEQLALFRGTSTLSQDAVFTNGGVFMGTVNGFNIFVYSNYYDDVDGSGNDISVDMWGTGKVVMASPEELFGVRAFGAIRDEDAGFQALPYFPKSWVEKDPSQRILLTQSAPLLVPERVNASLCATVL
jgi:Phage major capsid protein E